MSKIQKLHKEKYSKSIKVQAHHIDALNHVNNVVYLQWVQDLAKEHWQSKKLTEFDEQYIWVVVDHFLQYKGQAFLGDIITASTYIDKNEGVKSTRIVEFHANDRLIVSAKTHWALLDKKSSKPRRIPQQINELFFNED